MKLLKVNFESMVGQAIGIAILDNVSPQEIAAELRRMADVTERDGAGFRASLERGIQAANPQVPRTSG